MRYALGFLNAGENKNSEVRIVELKRLDAVSFEDVIYEKGECCLVGFSRSNCHVCQAVLPELEAVADKYEGKIGCYYVDIEADKDLYSRFSLKGVPTILFFKDGEYRGKMAGKVDEEQIEEKMTQLL